MHSNSQVDLGGSQMYIAGELRYRGKYTNKVSSATGEDGLNQITAAEPYPIEPPWINDYAAVRAAYPRATVVDNIILNASTVYSPGLYFVAGHVMTSGRDLDFSNVTIVCQGTISISCENFRSSSHTDGMSMIAYGSKISLSGRNARWDGTMFAPNGQIEFSGYSTNNVDLIGQRIVLSGENFTVVGNGGGGGPMTSEMKLVY